MTQGLIHDFGLEFYNRWCEMRRTWQGVHISAYPTDLFLYQMIVFENRPEVVVETGTYKGGKSLFFANMLDLVGGPGQVVTVDYRDKEFRHRPAHPRITYITGKSTKDPVLERVSAIVRDRPSMVILDSTHKQWHVKNELWHYNKFVTPGQYLIVESCYLNGHPIKPDHGPGPYEAVQWFLRLNRNFERVPLEEQFMVTKNPGGFLRRKV